MVPEQITGHKFIVPDDCINPVDHFQLLNSVLDQLKEDESVKVTRGFSMGGFWIVEFEKEMTFMIRDFEHTLYYIEAIE